jgi:hypothetical protein
MTQGAVLVAIDRLSLLVAHFRVAIARASSALLPALIDRQRHSTNRKGRARRRSRVI